jgi:hypothetical protein
LSAFAAGEANLRLRKQIQQLHRRLSLEHRQAAAPEVSPGVGPVRLTQPR